CSTRRTAARGCDLAQTASNSHRLQQIRPGHQRFVTFGRIAAGVAASARCARLRLQLETVGAVPPKDWFRVPGVQIGACDNLIPMEPGSPTLPESASPSYDPLGHQPTDGHAPWQEPLEDRYEYAPHDEGNHRRRQSFIKRRLAPLGAAIIA